MASSDEKLDLILAEVQGTKKDIKRLTDTQEKQFADFNRMFSEIKKDNSKIKATVIDLVKENKTLTNTIVELSSDVNSLKQQNLRNNLIVAGVPYKKGENLKEIFVKLSKTLNVEVTEGNFQIRRFAAKSDSISGNILVELDQYTVKKELLRRRKTKNILCSELGFGGESSVVLFNQLTHDNLEILAEAKKLKSECNFKFVWFQNNQILARKTEKAKIFTLNSKSDVIRLIVSSKSEPTETFFDSSEIIDLDKPVASSSKAGANKR